ncbi:MAG: mutX [Verrucomicrobiales bacterium]|nr:mutX [Verrucomicrobiales bacterium]
MVAARPFPADDGAVSDTPFTFVPTDWTGWQPGLVATLLFVVKEDRVLLIRKKRGLGAGKINGPGGKLDPGETPEQCAVRETEEELGVRAKGVREVGLLSFQFTDGLGLFCHVFRADDCEGEPVETDEAIPRWTKTDEIPFDEMWADDREWFHHLLADRKFMGFFDFEGDNMLSCRVDLVENLAR